MNSVERKQLTAQMKKHEALGALKFQKVVFLVEKIKFALLKKLFPNFIEKYDKFCDKRMKKALKSAKSEKEKEAIKRKYKMQKMEMRREFYQEKNRNYHMDPNNPAGIIRYLEWNKKIHQDALKKNAVLLPAFTIGSIFISPIFIPFAVLEAISAGINFECVNIQDYNLCRCKIMEDHLKKIGERNAARRQEEYGEAAKVIFECVEENEQLPSIDQILDKAQNPTQLEQLKKMLLEEAATRKREQLASSFKKPKEKESLPA